MRRIVLALAASGLLGFGGARVLLADDPKPAAGVDDARMKELVENLGSADFRVREAATKALIDLGEKARPALTAAKESTVPEVRFRADQILRRLDGKNREQPFDDGRPGDGDAPKPKPPGFGGWRWPEPPGGAGDDTEKWIRERLREMQEQMERRFGAQGFGVLPRRAQHFVADGADLTVSPRGARLVLTEKGADETTETHTYQGKSLDAILAAHPELKDKKGVASLVDQVTKADAEASKAPIPFSFDLQSQGVQVESTPGHVKVTVTEKGADGQPVTKTYEGTDLESLKKDHPELADKLGGIVLKFGGELPLPDAPDGLPGMTPLPPLGAFANTGPFGVGLARVERLLAKHLNLADDKGAVVVAVRPDSDASKIGLQVDDVIVSINGASCTLGDGPTSVRDLLRAAKDGPLTIDVLRAGKPLTLRR